LRAHLYKLLVSRFIVHENELTSVALKLLQNFEKEKKKEKKVPVSS